MTKIISISLTDEEKEFIDTMELSPTSLMKQKIMEIMGGTVLLRNENLRQKKALQEINKYLIVVRTFVEGKGLGAELDEFLINKDKNGTD